MALELEDADANFEEIFIWRKSTQLQKYAGGIVFEACDNFILFILLKHDN